MPTESTLQKNVLVCGASSGIGSALVQQLCQRKEVETIFTAQRRKLDFTNHKVQFIPFDASHEKDYDTLKESILQKVNSIDLIINCIGALKSHQPNLPERRVLDIEMAQLEWSMKQNTWPTLLLAKSLSKLLSQSEAPLFVALSAKVGSIADNRTGGWYSYRISKAALNMSIRTLAIEFQRLNKKSCFVAIHPGTTDTPLTKDFLASAAKKYKIHTSDETADNLLAIIDRLDSSQTGQFFNWNGDLLPW